MNEPDFTYSGPYAVEQEILDRYAGQPLPPRPEPPHGDPWSEPELEEDEPEPEEYDPGPEVDDEGGMSEYRHYPDWAEVDRAEYEREAGQ